MNKSGDLRQPMAAQIRLAAAGDKRPQKSRWPAAGNCKGAAVGSRWPGGLAFECPWRLSDSAGSADANTGALACGSGTSKFV